MDPLTFLNGKVVLHHGDCLDVIKTIESSSIHAVVTDPPYGIVFMGRKWDCSGPEQRAFAVEFWSEVYRVLKPGGHVLAFAATRTSHRLTCAIEDAGFEIRDLAMWMYGSGFPKSLNVSKAIDKHLGAERQKKRVAPRSANSGTMANGADTRPWIEAARAAGFHEVAGDQPASPEAEQWDGWGTALKPALEPITVARKPLAGTVAETVLAHGTGALNIDGCRVEMSSRDAEVIRNMGGFGKASYERSDGNSLNLSVKPIACRDSEPHAGGRWPANFVHDGSDEVVGAFPDAPGQQRAVGPEHGAKPSVHVYGDFGARDFCEPRRDAGSAARFFYTAKADADDRIGSKHPTVKPVDLMRWLVRLVTPPGGVVLDPFSGTGTTGEAAWREGFRAVLIERDPDHIPDIERRMALAMAGPDERRLKAAAARRPEFTPGGMFSIED